MFRSLTNNLLWSQGKLILAAIALLGLVGYLWFLPVFILSLGLFIFSLYFFRNPERVCPEASIDPSVIVCPADGMIVDIFSDPDSTSLLSHKISIFLSPIDVHVNWIPVDGLIETILYVPGSFLPAYLPKSSEQNEHTDILIRTPQEKFVVVRQIAGIVARRICWWISPGQAVSKGDKFGMIRFGSRVDLYLPVDVTLAVEMGQRVYGGQTVIARWK